MIRSTQRDWMLESFRLMSLGTERPSLTDFPRRLPYGVSRDWETEIPGHTKETHSVCSTSQPFSSHQYIRYGVSTNWDTVIPRHPKRPSMVVCAETIIPRPFKETPIGVSMDWEGVIPRHPKQMPMACLWIARLSFQDTTSRCLWCVSQLRGHHTKTPQADAFGVSLNWEVIIPRHSKHMPMVCLGTARPPSTDVPKTPIDTSYVVWPSLTECHPGRRSLMVDPEGHPGQHHDQDRWQIRLKNEVADVSL